MVLLYMVLHGSHQYTPFMLAYIPAPWILWLFKTTTTTNTKTTATTTTTNDDVFLPRAFQNCRRSRPLVDPRHVQDAGLDGDPSPGREAVRSVRSAAAVPQGKKHGF